MAEVQPLNISKKRKAGATNRDTSGLPGNRFGNRKPETEIEKHPCWGKEVRPPRGGFGGPNNKPAHRLRFHLKTDVVGKGFAANSDEVGGAAIRRYDCAAVGANGQNEASWLGGRVDPQPLP